MLINLLQGIVLYAILKVHIMLMPPRLIEIELESGRLIILHQQDHLSRNQMILLIKYNLLANVQILCVR